MVNRPKIHFGCILLISSFLFIHGYSQEVINIEQDKIKSTTSSGQPVYTFWSLGTMGGYQWNTKKASTQLYLKMRNTSLLKRLQVLNWEASIGSEQIDTRLSPSFGGYINFFWFSLGARYRPAFIEQKFVPVLAVENALHRGGTFGIRKAEIRAEWTPGVFSIGLNLNIGDQPGQQRQRKAHVDLPKGNIPLIYGLDHDLINRKALEDLEQSIIWIDRLVSPSITKKCLAEIKEHLMLTGYNLQKEDDLYHESLEKAFATALEKKILDPLDRTLEARRIAEKAENIIFKKIIIPFNQLLGQRKIPMNIKGLGLSAFDSFVEYIDAQIGRKPYNLKTKEALKYVFRQVVEYIDQAAQNSRFRWMDNRFAEFLTYDLKFKDSDTSIFNLGVLCWLPLNYGLRPHQYDSQAELNKVLGDILGRPFTDHNKIAYLINEQWHHEFLKTIKDTKYYHVFLIHDYRGVNDDRIIDNITWDVSINGYGEAILRGINEYLSGKRAVIPHFSIFIDQFFYELNQSRKVLTFLENLYGLKPVKLKKMTPPSNLNMIEHNNRIDEIAHKITNFQNRLKTAILRLKNEKGWTKQDIKKQIKVHINVTNKADETYGAYFIKDDLIRDHRKIVLRDIFEDIPCWGNNDCDSGVAIFTGQGIGEHYVGPGWEDRSIKIQGIDLVYLKDSIRQLFLDQCPRYKIKDVPHYLCPRPYPADYEYILDGLRKKGFDSSVVTVMNQTGYRSKKASVLKAALYNLMPEGSIIIAPDSIWNNDFWLSMFFGASLRGVHTYLIGTSTKNAPAKTALTLGSIRNTLIRGMYIAELFKEELQKSGGSLNVGLYNTSIDATNFKERLEIILKGFKEHTKINEVCSFHPDVIEQFKEIKTQLDENYLDQHTNLLEDENIHDPHIHLKSQFFMSKSGLKILNLKEWKPIIGKYCSERINQTTGRALDTEGITPNLLKVRADSKSPDLFEAYANALTSQEVDNALFFLTVGSHNQDRRSMFLDGEVLVGVAGYDSLIAIVDMIYLLHSSVWPKHLKEFNQYLSTAITIDSLLKDLL